jgi:hypothetical protein
LQDLFVCATSQEDVLAVIGRMKLYTEWSLSVRETLNNFSSFRVPKLNDLVKARAQEASPIVTEANISHSFAMPHVSPHAASVSKDIPYFDCAIMTCREQEMAELWEELNSLDSFVMASIGVQELLGNEACMLLLSQVAWRI